MTLHTPLTPSEAPRPVSDAPARSCATEGCNREAQRDAVLCSRCLTDTWMLREPEWVRRAKAKALSPKVYA